jgi:hypothetical protein
VTGRTLSSDRLTFQPDFTFFANADYAIRIEMGGDADVCFRGAVRQGQAARRDAQRDDADNPRQLLADQRVDRLSHRPGRAVALFANNMFNTEYFESYIEKTTLSLAGLPASDLGITGDRRRYRRARKPEVLTMAGTEHSGERKPLDPPFLVAALEERFGDRSSSAARRCSGSMDRASRISLPCCPTPSSSRNRPTTSSRW